MFGNSMARNNQGEAPSINLIQSDTVIEGDVKANGDIRIDGTLKGTLHVKGKLVVGATGNIEGEMHCQNADVSGTIKGKIFVSELLALKTTAKLTGDIVTGKLAIEPGASFSGSCSMGGAVIKDIKQVDQKNGQPAKIAEKAI
jgi:cytoskeletal protein CcmA (bactofilin family)